MAAVSCWRVTQRGKYILRAAGFNMTLMPGTELNTAAAAAAACGGVLHSPAGTRRTAAKGKATAIVSESFAGKPCESRRW
jgi:hypothetical protein